jgi:hypothetical protein
MKLSTGDYVALLDADDAMPVRSIEARVGYLEANPDKEAVFANSNCRDRSGVVYHERRPTLTEGKNLALNFLLSAKVPFHAMTLVYARKVFDKVGYFDSSMTRAEDMDFTFRVLSIASVGYIDEVVYDYYVGTHDFRKRVKIRTSAFYSRLRLIKKNVHEPVRFLLYLRTLTIEPLKLCWDVFSYKK